MTLTTGSLPIDHVSLFRARRASGALLAVNQSHAPLAVTGMVCGLRLAPPVAQPPSEEDKENHQYQEPPDLRRFVLISMCYHCVDDDAPEILGPISDRAQDEG
ncbi:MAG TPA: hypothetical protein VLU73_07495, partial [Methylococcaceae bacterium]|nr:hypothetical protein [Methylococcaceae bacterium]